MTTYFHGYENQARYSACYPVFVRTDSSDLTYYYSTNMEVIPSVVTSTGTETIVHKTYKEEDTTLSDPIDDVRVVFKKTNNP